jgi:hypothetical protein
MKTKLLRKVRKRFEIFHLPTGFVDKEGYHFNYNLLRLVDNENNYAQYAQIGRNDNNYCGINEIFNTEKEAIEFLKHVIIRRLRSEGHRGAKDKQKISKKIWHI